MWSWTAWRVIVSQLQRAGAQTVKHWGRSMDQSERSEEWCKKDCQKLRKWEEGMRGREVKQSPAHYHSSMQSIFWFFTVQLFCEQLCADHLIPTCKAANNMLLTSTSPVTIRLTICSSPRPQSYHAPGWPQKRDALCWVGGRLTLSLSFLPSCLPSCHSVSLFFFFHPTAQFQFHSFGVPFVHVFTSLSIPSFLSLSLADVTCCSSSKMELALRAI